MPITTASKREYDAARYRARHANVRPYRTGLPRDAYLRAWRDANPDAVQEYKMRRRAGGSVSAADVRTVRETCDGLCSYCLGPGSEIEHIVPLARGGENSLENLTLSCRPCNLRKATKTPLEML